MDYLIHILILVGIYILLASSLNLVAGMTGLLSVAHAAFFGMGAYAFALAAAATSGSFAAGMVCAFASAGLCGAIVCLPSLRTRGDYFIVATFAFQVVVVGVLNNLVSITGGPLGLSGIPRPSLLGTTIVAPVAFLGLVAAVCGVGLWGMRRIVYSPFGRLLRAIRDSASMAECLGKDTSRARVEVFVISAAIAGVAGGLYASHISFVDPSSFGVMESVLILTMVILGGAGSFRGPVLGAIVLVMLPESLRFCGMPSAVASHANQILYGLILIALMFWQPKGLFGEYGLDRKLERE